MSSISVVPIFVAICCLATADANRLLRPALSPLTPNGRIVGGVDVSIEDVPWQASLQVFGMSYCGATIIAKEWVITAASCVDVPELYLNVRTGSSRKSQGGTLHLARTIITHQDYTINRYGIPENDIALIRVQTPFIMDASRKAIPLFNYQEEATEGALSVITGWGTLFEDGIGSEVLQMVSIPVVSKTVCSEAYTSYGGLPEGQICAGNPNGGKDACNEDFGGPMTIGGRLAGIVSWGNGCARPGYPGVYTEIAAYRNWIAEKARI